MPSYKFSSRPPARKRPAICKPPPKATPSNELPRPPIQLNTYMNFTDLDPLDPFQLVKTFLSLWFPATKLYFGRSPPAANGLQMTLVQEPNPDFYTAFFAGWRAGIPGPPFVYPNIWVDPSKPFATPRFGDVLISGFDYRIAQLSE